MPSVAFSIVSSVLSSLFALLLLHSFIHGNKIIALLWAQAPCISRLGAPPRVHTWCGKTLTRPCGHDVNYIFFCSDRLFPKHEHYEDFFNQVAIQNWFDQVAMWSWCMSSNNTKAHIAGASAQRHYIRCLSHIIVMLTMILVWNVAWRCYLSWPFLPRSQP